VTELIAAAAAAGMDELVLAPCAASLEELDRLETIVVSRATDQPRLGLLRPAAALVRRAGGRCSRPG
jgi:hypothetical protein